MKKKQHERLLYGRTYAMEDELVKQVQILADIVRAQSERLDEAFKLMEQVTGELRQTTLEQKESTDAFNLTNEALMDSLADLDGVADDLAKVAAALLTLQQEEEQEQQGG